MNDPYHVYMDLDVVNNDYNATSKSHLRFEETRNMPFLPGDSADYFCSIVRFNIQTGNTLPVLIPKIETGQSDVNKTIYQVAFMYDMLENEETLPDKFGFAAVEYAPEDETAPTPPAPINSQDLSSSYYYVYNYQHFIHLINKAMETAWANLLASSPIVVDLVGDTIPPFIDFNPDTNRVMLTADNRLFNSEVGALDLDPETTDGAIHLRLLFNDRLYELLSGLPFRRVLHPQNLASLQTLGGRDCPWYAIRFIDRHNNKSEMRLNVIEPGSDPPIYKKITVLQANQEMTSIALWNPVASIVFASSLLPVIATQTSLPRDVGEQRNHLVSGGNNSNLLPILSDFSIAVDATNQYRPMVEYNPGAEYRLLDMNSTANLSRMDIIVYWKDRSGGLHPFELQPGCAASVKLMFRRKDFDVGL